MPTEPTERADAPQAEGESSTVKLASQGAASARVRAPDENAGDAPPRQLDIVEFARAAGGLSGEAPIAALPRLLQTATTPPPGETASPLHWQASGERRMSAVGESAGTNGASMRAEPALGLRLDGAVWLVCQRCLEPFLQPMSVSTRFQIVESEDEADAAPLDDDEFDVIVASRRFDLLDLVDEEAVLSLPLVPRHEVCPTVHGSLISSGLQGEGGEAAAGASGAAASKQSPFAGLAVLRGAPDTADTDQANDRDASDVPDAADASRRPKSKGGSS